MRHVVLLLAATHTASALNQITICAGKVQVQQDPRFATLLPFQRQQLPLDYCAAWPIWVTKQGGKVPVTRVAGPAEGADMLETWAPPAAFQQLWLPQDLPLPTARAAVGLVLRNGEPRYVFPTVDAFVESEGAQWRNRGLNSVPLATTWLHFGEATPETLRLTAFTLPPPPGFVDEFVEDLGAASGGSGGDDDAEQPADASARQYELCLPGRPVAAAIDAALEALDELPPVLRRTSLGDGYCYLVAPLTPDGGDESSLLPASALTPGSRLRVFLAEEGAEQSTGPSDIPTWQVGELDLTMRRLPPGRDSPYMQGVYKPLFEATHTG